MALLISLIVTLTLLTAGDGRQDADDPALRAAVEQFVATQQREDADAYLALWSESARRPERAMLQYIFDSGDDEFSNVAVVRVVRSGDVVRVRVSAERDRSTPGRTGGSPVHVRSRMMVSLTYVKDRGEWKLVREGPATDDLAAALIEAATPDAREQLLAADGDLVTPSLVSALSRRGTEAAQLQQYPAAQAAFERALGVAQRIGDTKAEGESIQNVANALYFQRNFPRALELYQQRLSLEQGRRNDEGAAAALAGIATIKYSYAEYGAALAAYRQALALQEQLNDQGAVATTLISTGNVLYLQGDYDGAIAEYRRSRDLYSGSTNPAGVADALAGLGRVYVAQGDFPAALESFAGVLAEARARGVRATQGTTLMSIGEIHVRLGNLQAALTAFEESRGHFEAVGDSSHVGRLGTDVALVHLVAGRFSLAEQQYGRAATVCESAQDKECVGAATVGLAFAQAAQDKFEQSIASYRRAIERFTALNSAEQAARAEVGLSVALLGAGQPDAAIDAAGRARETAIGLGNDDVLWRALVSEARAYRRLEAEDKAIGAAKAAASAVQRLDELARARPGTVVPRDTTTVFACLAILRAEAGDPAAAFDAAERLRVHDLRTVLTRSEREIARGMTAGEREQERAAAVEIVSLHAQLSRERALPRPDPDRVADLDKRLADAASRRSAQQAQLFARLPALKIWRGLFDASQSSDLGSVLREGRMLLEFVVDEDGLLVLSAWSADDELTLEAHVSPLPRRQLAESIAQMLQPPVLQDSGEWRRAAAPLVAAIPPSVLQKAASAREVIVVPHEILWRVPFEALPAGDGYLGDSVRLSYSASVSSLLRAPEIARPEAMPVLAIAAPELSADRRDRVARTAPDWTLRPSDIAAREAASATAPDTTRGAVHAGASATENAVREQLGRAGTLHIAAPFRVNGASPLFSPILLAEQPEAAPTAEADGVLELREVMNLDLSARVAVVSDPAALSMRDAAADAGIVQWAWRGAGATHVVLQRWRVPDAVDDAVVGELHRRLRQGQDPAAALAEARQAIRRLPGRSAPFYWAGWFSLGGP